MSSILVISPHADDEVLGCGGMIALSAAAGHEVTVIYGAVGGCEHRHLAIQPSTEDRVDEIRRAAETLGVYNWSVLYRDMELRLDTLPQTQLISALDAVLDRGFDEVYFAYPSHHQDHQALYSACIAALRPGAHPQVKLIALYEYVYPGWFSETQPGGRMYIDITDVFEIKRAAWACYASQQRPLPNPLSNGVVETIGRLRGLECCVPYAELFHVLHLIR